MTYEVVVKRIGVALEKDFSGFSGFIAGDRYCLEQVFSNLVVNALQAMEDSFEKFLQITVATASEPNFVDIILRDTGCGIPEQSLDDIFKPYMTLKKENGTGLGLHVVKAIVADLGGIVRVESLEGKGTTFTVRLPQAGRIKPSYRAGAESFPAPFSI